MFVKTIPTHFQRFLNSTKTSSSKHTLELKANLELSGIYLWWCVYKSDGLTRKTRRFWHLCDFIYFPGWYIHKEDGEEMESKPVLIKIALEQYT